MIRPPSGRPPRKRGKIVAKRRLAVEVIGTGKGRIGGDAVAAARRAKAEAQHVERERLAVVQPRAARAAALPHPGIGRDLGDDFQQRRRAPAEPDARADGRRRKSGRWPNVSMKAVSWRGDFDRQRSGCKRCIIAMRIFCVIGRKRPARSGLKPSLIGWNGPVSVTCRPIAARFWPELSCSSASASSAEDAAPPSSPTWR